MSWTSGFWAKQNWGERKLTIFSALAGRSSFIGTGTRTGYYTKSSKTSIRKTTTTAPPIAFLSSEDRLLKQTSISVRHGGLDTSFRSITYIFSFYIRWITFNTQYNIYKARSHNQITSFLLRTPDSVLQVRVNRGWRYWGKLQYFYHIKIQKEGFFLVVPFSALCLIRLCT